jgi:hypothetical protein
VAATAAAAVLASAVSAHGSRVAKCSTADLHVWVTHTGAALGTVGGYLAFTNRRARACSLHGWPTLTALRPGATATAVHVRQTMFGPDGVRSIPTVVLRHGQTAVAAFTTSDIGRGPTGACPPSFRELRVTPPGNRRSAVVSAYLAWFGRELPDCTGIFVSMVAPASALPPRG